MPARVHAILVVRPDPRAASAEHLRRTLAAIAEQTRPVDALTLVLCGEGPGIREIAEDSGAVMVIEASRSTGFAAATVLATPGLSGDAVWLLAQDTAPEPDALHRLVGALELAPSVAFAAPKVVEWDDRGAIVSLGVSMTRLGRTVGLADGELDQGQHDRTDDVLGSDVRGVLVRRETWTRLNGLDAGLAGADEGLDLGVRSRLAGGRVALAPTAVVAAAGDGVAGVPGGYSGARRRRRVHEARTAQLHRRLVYARAWAVPLLWSTVLPLALWRTAGRLVAKDPGLVLAEWGAGFRAAWQWRTVAAARSGIRRTRTTSWPQLAGLRVSQTDLRRRFEPDVVPSHRVLRGDLHFFTGGGAWTVLAAVIAAAAVFPALLAWPVLGGGALQPLRATVAQLWADASWGRRGTGLDLIAPADPFAAVIAVLGSLSPVDPSAVLVALWLAALPLAVLGGWFAATRITERPLLRIMGGVLWALAPAFLGALVDGRPTAVIAHLLLPWLFFAGTVAHRSWAASGAASLCFAGVVAAAPSLAPALLVLWAGAIVAVVVVRAGSGVSRVAWIVVPAVALAAPLAWRQARAMNGWALLADPGVVARPVTADRALVALGFPTADPGGWSAFAGASAWWVPLLLAPLALLALAAPLTRRWSAGAALVVVAVLGAATAVAASGIAVSSIDATVVALLPNPGLSLAWLGALGAALVTLDAGIVPKAARVRVPVAVAAMLAVAVVALPALTASDRGVAAVAAGPESTLPAYVAAQGRDDPSLGTIQLRPLDDGGVSARVVWGGGETIGAQSTVAATAVAATPEDAETADLVADLVADAAVDVVDRLRARGVAFVLLATPDPASEVAGAFALGATNALDQREGLDRVGETGLGQLWRVVPDAAPRPVAAPTVQTAARLIAALQIGAVAVALLLAVPTVASRREARRSPRVVGLGVREVTS